MSPRRDLGPWQAALLALFGTTLPGVFFMFPKMLMHSGLLLRLIPALALLACGFTIYLKFISILKDGIQNHRWTEDQLQSLRLVLESPYCSVVNFSLLVAYVVLQFFVPHLKGLGWVCFLLTMAVSQLIAAVHRPRPRPPSSLPIWRDLTPIRSDHWGQR
jgi:hypothetical protein